MTTDELSAPDGWRFPNGIPEWRQIEYEEWHLELGHLKGGRRAVQSLVPPPQKPWGIPLERIEMTLEQAIAEARGWLNMKRVEGDAQMMLEKLIEAAERPAPAPATGTDTELAERIAVAVWHNVSPDITMEADFLNEAVPVIAAALSAAATVRPPVSGDWMLQLYDTIKHLLYDATNHDGDWPLMRSYWVARECAKAVRLMEANDERCAKYGPTPMPPENADDPPAVPQAGAHTCLHGAEFKECGRQYCSHSFAASVDHCAPEPAPTVTPAAPHERTMYQMIVAFHADWCPTGGLCTDPACEFLDGLSAFVRETFGFDVANAAAAEAWAASQQSGQAGAAG